MESRCDKCVDRIEWGVRSRDQSVCGEMCVRSHGVRAGRDLHAVNVPPDEVEPSDIVGEMCSPGGRRPDSYSKCTGRVSEAIAAVVDDAVEPEGCTNQSGVLTNAGAELGYRVQDSVGRDLVETLHRGHRSSIRVWGRDGVTVVHQVCAEGPYAGVVRYIFDPGGCVNLRL